MKKLNIGCGPNYLEGWLNTDIAPCTAGVRYLDATRPFPFADEQFDRVYSEHMIEHVAYRGGVAMLGECYRVLKPGGRIRISTPSLEFLIDLMQNPDSHVDYIGWACGLFSPGAPMCPEAVVNNFVRAWGHLFIWSRRLLAGDMEQVGFRGLKHLKVGESDDPELNGLENVERMPPGFLQLETMTIEGDKPSTIPPG